MEICNSCETILKFNEICSSIESIKSSTGAILFFILLFAIAAIIFAVYFVAQEDKVKEEERKKIVEKILKEKD